MIDTTGKVQSRLGGGRTIVKHTYPPGTICICCFNEKADKTRPGRCWYGKRHRYNREPFTVTVEKVPVETKEEKP